MAFESLSDKLSGIFKKLKSKGKLSESDVKVAMREVKLALLEADVNYKVVKDFVVKITDRAIGEEVLNSLTPSQQVIKIVNEELTNLMGNHNSRIKFPSKPPCVIMMCGLQGSGKTTHCAKLGKYFKSQGRRPLLVACDIYRPAAIDQLKIVGNDAGVEVFEMGQSSAVKIAKEAIKHSKDYGYDTVIIDTAGRLHIDEQLMGELVDIKNECNPNEILLVVDSMLGQDAVNIASKFNENLDIDGIILTKLDGDARGGSALSILSVSGKPIKFIGIGEKVDDIEAFHPERMASRILGMGDILTLIEKTQSRIDEGEAKRLSKKFSENKFDLNDLLAQMKQIQKMGSIRQLMSMIPGIGNQIKDVEIDESQLGRIEAIITSMTIREREKPSIINHSRKLRISKGSGTKVEDVNRLLKQFDQMQKMMKKLSGKVKSGKRNKLPLSNWGNLYK